jgi:hypothetical protein
MKAKPVPVSLKIGEEIIGNQPCSGFGVRKEIDHSRKPKRFEVRPLWQL